VTTTSSWYTPCWSPVLVWREWIGDTTRRTAPIVTLGMPVVKKNSNQIILC